MRISLAVALALVALPHSLLHARVTADDRSVSVPFELSNGRIFVSAYVNERGPYRFGFDTGASGDGRADSQLTAALSLPKVDRRATSDGVVTSSADVVAVRSLRLGPVEKRNVELLSRDYNGGAKPAADRLMGIIGRDFFADWLVTIDYPAKTITFEQAHLRRGEPGVIAFAPGLSIPVCFKARCFAGKIDTGSSRSIVAPKDVVGKLSVTAPNLIGEAKRTNSVAKLYQMSLLEPVRIGNLKVDGQKVLVADPSGTVINIGSDFLKDYVLTIDQRRQLLRIRRP